jgi:single-stranded-DNA-specific exonuclease
MKKHWKVLPQPPKEHYEKFPELPKPVVDLLYHRNITTQEKIDEFLNPEYSKDVHDPFLFHDMQRSVEKIFTSIESGERITIHGDYDADGVSGATILTQAIKAVGGNNISVYLPHREIDGYGINNNTIDTLKKEGTKLIVTCDCGISNYDEIKYANDNNIDVIITDHHSIPDKIPEAYAILHPKLPTEDYPDQTLAGGGVAFKLAQGLLRTHKKQGKKLVNDESHEAVEKWLLDMVAIASVADMVPLIGESRTLTKYGLLVLNKTRRKGMQKLLMEAKVMHEDGTLKKEIDSEVIGYTIAPRINAAGRLNHANVAYQLMITEDPIEATDLAYTLDQNNKERQKITERCVNEAIEQIEKDQKDNPILFVFGSDWPSGIIGLVAGKLKETYSKPSVAMTYREDTIIGSGRSVPSFNFIESIQEVPEYFEKFGGHPMAFGFTLKNRELLEKMKTALYEKHTEKTKGKDLTPILNIDAAIELDDVNWELFDLLEKFAPFGKENEKPLYMASQVEVHNVIPLGKEKKHLKLYLKSNTGKIKMAIGWQLCRDSDGQKNWCKLLHKGDLIDIAFEINVNEWNGNRELRLQIVDLKK